MPEAAGAEPQHLCGAADLVERGPAVGFDVLQYREPVRAFALRFEGRVVAYLNRCAHVPAEMDGPPGEFLDRTRRFIVCSIHGAEYEPRSGRCASGPCGRGKLQRLDVVESAGEVYWVPTRDIRPAFDG